MASAAALAIVQGKYILIFEVLKRLRAFQNLFFTEGVVTETAAVTSYVLSRENGITERPQTLRYPEIINHNSAEYGQSAAEAIKIVLHKKSHRTDLCDGSWVVLQVLLSRRC